MLDEASQSGTDQGDSFFQLSRSGTESLSCVLQHSCKLIFCLTEIFGCLRAYVNSGSIPPRRLGLPWLAARDSWSQSGHSPSSSQWS